MRDAPVRTLAMAGDDGRFEAFATLQSIISHEVPFVVPVVSLSLAVADSSIEGLWSSGSGTQLHLEDASVDR